MTAQLGPAIVRICGADGNPVGAGFLVAGTQVTVLTCAHVVARALALADDTCDPPQAEVYLDFPLITPQRILATRVIHWTPPQPNGQGDVAALELIDTLPDDARPTLLARAEDLWGHHFRAFGFPAGHDNGIWASGELCGRQAAGWVQIEGVKAPGYRVQPGFSGTPVWDEQLGKVVGMAVAAESQPEVKAAFIIPTDVLVKTWPMLGTAVLDEPPDEKWTLAESDLPFSLESIPRAESFVGRSEELAFFRSQVEEYNFAVIRGMAGVGKTALAAELAWGFQQAGWNVFWLTLIPGLNDNIEELVARLAGFLLVVGGDDRLWKMLQAETAEGQRFDLNRKYELFLKSVEQGRYLICIDDFHIITEDDQFKPLFQLLMRRFDGRRWEYPVKILVVGRKMPAYMAYLLDEYRALPGLSIDDAQAFLARHQVQLDYDQFKTFYRRTEGNSQIVNLSLRRLQTIQGNREKVEQFIANLQHQNQSQVLMEDIRNFLSKGEQLILSAISLFRGTAVGRLELEAVLLDDEEVIALHDGLQNLARWHVAQQNEENQVSLHDLVREYAYARIDPAPRRRMHERAGRYYEEKQNYIEASYHYFEAGQFNAAAATLAGRTRLLTYQGHRDTLLVQLERLRKHQSDLSPVNWIVVVEGLGDVYLSKGEYEAAIGQFEESVRLQKTMDVPSGLARTYNKLGEVYMLCGDYIKVAEACEIGLERALAEGDVTEETRAHMLRGVAYYEQGDAERAAAAHQKSLAMAEALGNPILTARSYMFLAMDQEGLNQYTEAAANHRKSLNMFLEMGDTFNAASAYSNLGGIYHDRGDVDQALAYYQQGLDMAVENGDSYNVALAKGNMGELYHMLRDYVQAESHLQVAIAISRDMGQVYFLTVFSAVLGEVKLALGDLRSALELGESALALARETGQRLQQGMAHRVLGEVYTHMGDRPQAEANLRAAVRILEVVDSPVEEAKAKRSYGTFLLNSDEQEHGTAYLQQALTIFGMIEADREMAGAGISLG